MKSLGETLSDYARQKGMTVKHIVARSGLSALAVQAVLTGTGNYHSASLVALALAKKIRISHLRSRKLRTPEAVAKTSGLSVAAAEKALHAIGAIAGGSGKPADDDVSLIHVQTLDLAVAALGGRYELIG